MPISGVRVYANNVHRWLHAIYRAEQWFQTVKANNRDWFPDKTDDYVYVMRGAEAFGKNSFQTFSEARHRDEQQWRQLQFRLALEKFYEQVEMHLREQTRPVVAVAKAA